MRTLIRILLLTALAASVWAHDYVPGPRQTHPVLLKGGTVFTITNGVLENTDLLFEDGLITRMAPNIAAPDGAEVIDVTGRHVYPGIIALGTNLGLVEIGEVRATVDHTEVGSITPEVQTHIAYNPDSEIIPTTRSNGIAYAQIVPGGALLRGRSCLLNLDAWTKEDAAVKTNTGLHLSWPGVGVSNAWWETRSPEEQRKAQKRNREKLYQAFDDARAYKLAKEADPHLKIDARWEAMLPVLSGDLPVFVHADDYRQIEQAIDFTAERGLRMILMGGKEAWRLTDQLVAYDIPVVYNDPAGLPQKQDDPYDQAFQTLALLHEAGVKVSIEARGATGVRNLPFSAGMAAAWGLPQDVALRAITLTPAEILGVDDRIGSLEVGKNATVIVSDGDVMDHITHNVTHMFIDGRKVDLNSKHKELYEKYRHRKVAR